jgi:hypothetical protein
MLQADKDLVEIYISHSNTVILGRVSVKLIKNVQSRSVEKFTKNLSNLHILVILAVYIDKKQKGEDDMKLRLNDNYYFWCCDWCDSENLVLWAKIQDGTSCGACHRPMSLPDLHGTSINSNIAAGLC